MQNDTEKQEKVDKIKRLIDEARKARDTDTVKALGEEIFKLTGVQEPEFAAVEPSGNPKLDKLRKHLVDAIAARDEETEAALRELISKEEGEKLPEVTVELTAEEPESVENPFAEREDEEVVDEAELTPFVAEDYTDKEAELLDPTLEDVLLADMLGDSLMITQLAALKKAGLETEEDLRQYLPVEGDKAERLVQITGIGKASAKTILETLGYEA